MRRFFILFVSIITIIGCDEEKDVNFSIDLTTEITVIATLGIEAEQKATSALVNPQIEEAYNTNNTESGLVNDMKFSSIQLVLESPEDQSFSFIDDVEIYITSVDPEMETLIGSAQNIGITQSINFDRVSIDIQEYIKSGNVGFKILYTSDEFAQINRECKIVTRIAVDAIER